MSDNELEFLRSEVERLRQTRLTLQTALSATQQENERLRKALKPFADRCALVEWVSDRRKVTVSVSGLPHDPDDDLTVGDFSRARVLLATHAAASGDAETEAT